MNTLSSGPARPRVARQADAHSCSLPPRRHAAWIARLTLALAITLTLSWAVTACDGAISTKTQEPDGPAAPVKPTDPLKPDDVLPPGDQHGLDASQPPPFQEGEDCSPHQAYFEQRVFQDVMEHWCVGCHSPSGIAAGTRLVLEPLLPMTFDAEPVARTPEQLAALNKRNFESASLVARDLSQGVSMLLLKPTDRLSHLGGKMLQPDSEDYRKLATFVARVNGAASECAQPATYACDQQNPWPGHGRVRRLSHDEYDRTTSALLGQDLRHAQSFAADVEVHGYLNSADALRASPILVEQWLNTAELLAETYILELNQRLSCAARADRACAQQFVESFGRRAFRRPMTTQDVERYLKLYDETARHLGFTEGVRDVLTAMLVSPHFLYRMELGTVDAQTGVCVLGSYELANELSYMIWGTMPDEPLMAAAQAGELDTPEGLAAQAQRMLKDERGKLAFRDFVFKWMHLDRFTSVVRDANTYPEFDNDVRTRMLAEAEAFVDGVYAQGQGSLRELFTARERSLDATLAGFYGLQVPQDGQRHPVTLAEDRAGVLGLGAFLTTHAGGDRSSPVHRGALVRERLLCQELPPPPPALNINEGAIDPNLTTRERFAKHSQDAACAGCHRLVDPIGFVFEGYDGVGRQRDVYERGGAPVNTRGAIIASRHSDGPLQGLGSLSQRMASSPDAPSCFTQQAVYYRYGVRDAFEHGCTIEVLEDRFTRGDLSFEALIQAMTQTPHFRQRAPAHWTSAHWYGGERPQAPDPGMTPVPEPEPTPQPEPPAPTPVLPGQIVLNDPALRASGGPTNDWGAGYCAEYDVTNTGQRAVTWTLTMEVDGTLNTHWESQVTAMSGRITFSGVQHNRAIEPGQKAHFGFCANR